MDYQTFNISLPIELVKRADVVAKKEYRGRSELLREALRIYLEDQDVWENIFSLGKIMAKKTGVKNDSDINRIVRRYRHG